MSISSWRSRVMPAATNHNTKFLKWKRILGNYSRLVLPPPPLTARRHESRASQLRSLGTRRCLLTAVLCSLTRNGAVLITGSFIGSTTPQGGTKKHRPPLPERLPAAPSSGRPLGSGAQPPLPIGRGPSHVTAAAIGWAGAGGCLGDGAAGDGGRAPPWRACTRASTSTP